MATREDKQPEDKQPEDKQPGALARTVVTGKEMVKWSAAQVGRLVWRAVSRGLVGLLFGLVLAMASLWLAAQFSELSSLKAGYTLLVASIGCFAMGMVWGLRGSLTVTVEQVVDQIMEQVQAGIDKTPGVSTSKLVLTMPQVEERIAGVVDSIRAGGKGNFISRRVRKMGAFAADKAGASLVKTCRKAATKDEDGVARVDVIKTLEAGARKIAREKAVDATAGRLNILLAVLAVVTIFLLALPAIVG